MIGSRGLRKSASEILEVSAYGFPHCICKFSQSFKCVTVPCECARELSMLARKMGDALDQYYSEQIDAQLEGN
jgi:hypothetical protein